MFFFLKIPGSVIYSIISDGLTFLLHFFPLKFLAIMKAQNHEMSILFGLEEHIFEVFWFLSLILTQRFSTRVDL